MTPETLAAIGAVMSNPWWGAVGLLCMMIFHFAWITRRDKSIEARFSEQFDAIISMEHVRAQADIDAAVALTEMASEVRHLTSAVSKCPGPQGQGA